MRRKIRSRKTKGCEGWGKGDWLAMGQFIIRIELAARDYTTGVLRP